MRFLLLLTERTMLKKLRRNPSYLTFNQVLTCQPAKSTKDSLDLLKRAHLKQRLMIIVKWQIWTHQSIIKSLNIFSNCQTIGSSVSRNSSGNKPSVSNVTVESRSIKWQMKVRFLTF